MPNTLAVRLRALREQSRATQQQLATHCGVARATVAQWEAASKMPSRDNLVKLADYYRISLDDLVRNTPHATTWPASADEAETLRLLRHAAPGVRSAVLTLLQHKPAAPEPPGRARRRGRPVSD